MLHHEIAAEGALASRMHDVSHENIRTVDLVLDYSRRRLTTADHPLDKPETRAELERLAGGREERTGDRLTCPTILVPVVVANSRRGCR